MDLKTFSDNDFDPKKWINKAWSTSENQEKEIFVANTVARLQLYMKQLSNSLDETTTQIVSSIPRVLQDAAALQLDGALLQQQLSTLEQQVQGVEQQTGHSIQSLQRIDQLKTRLENAASALREADKWVALATSLEDILEAGVPTQRDKLAELADQVAAMTASLEVEWLTSVLKSDTPLAELLRLYTDLLLSLDPSPTKVVTANFKLCQTPDDGITLLIDLKSDIDEFINCIRNLIDAPRPNKEELLPATLRELGRAIYAPLRELMPKYTDLQTTLFLSHLDDPMLKQEDLLEYSRAVLSIAERSEAWLGAAYGRAKTIAGPAAYPYYAPAVEAFTSALLNLITSHTRHIESSFLSSVSAGQTAGVLSDTFPASLLLESAVTQLLSVLAERQRVEEADEEPTPQHPLLDLPTLILDVDARGTRRAPPLSVAGLRRAKDALRNLARSILRNPIDVQLDKIPQLSVWHNNDALSTELPDFALSPQEYITEIGQYLMTLPQHLEMHLSEKQAPWQFLTELCTHTCEAYAQRILAVRNMDALGTKRCLTDILYLSSVVDDLGGSVSPALRSLERSLRASAPAARAD